MKIADVHAHVFPDALAQKASVSIGSFYGVEMAETAADLHTLLEENKKAGISRCLISNSAVTPKQVTNINNFLSEAAGQDESLMAFGSVYPGMEGIEQELLRMKALGLRGVKIHPDFQKLPIDDETAIESYRLMAKLELPVLFHMGDNRYDYSSPQRLKNLLHRVPSLRVIAAHFGGWSNWEAALACVQPENVVYDTSSSLPFLSQDMVLRFIDTFGPERILYGTDSPMWSPKRSVSDFLALPLDKATQEDILYNNFVRFFDCSES